MENNKQKPTWLKVFWIFVETIRAVRGLASRDRISEVSPQWFVATMAAVVDLGRRSRQDIDQGNMLNQDSLIYFTKQYRGSVYIMNWCHFAILVQGASL